jgi:hypothetical protein
MEPLSKKRRIISLSIFLAVFFICVPILFAYSSGYRFNIKDFRIVETGGIYIYSDLRDTRVFVDDEFYKNSGTILRNTLIQRLPAEDIYSIRVEKDDYYPYYKELYIDPNRVTEVSVMMLPVDIPFTPVPQTIEVVGTSSRALATTSEAVSLVNPEYQQIALLFATSTLEQTPPLRTEIEIPTPFNSQASSTILVLNEKVVLLPKYILDLQVEDIKNKEKLQEKGRLVTWLEGGDIHVMWAGEFEDTPYYFCDVRGCRDSIIVSTDTDINDYDYYPGRDDVLLITTANDIFAIEIDDRSRNNLQPVFTGTEEPLFRVVGSTLYVQDGDNIFETQI